MWRRGGVVLIALLLAGAGFSVSAADFYVSPSGTTGTGPGTGTISNPWALQTALSQPAAVHPGDTIWLRGGTYTGEFASHLTGTANAPIVVRQYPGERASLDGNFNPLILGNHVEVLTIASGGYTWFWGLEVMNSNPNRYNPTPGSNPADARGGGINANVVGTKIINCVIHDAGGGIGFWSGATNSELYGNIIYYNGWNAPDRGHGHGIYAQHYGVSGTKLLKHNILFDPAFDGCLNMQAYGSSTAGFKNSTVDGNVFSRGEVLVGGNSGFLLTGTVVKNNGSWMTGNAFGYYCANMTSTSYVNNYDVGALGVVSSFTPPYDHGTWGQTTITGNTFIGPLDGFTQTDFPSNTYYANPPLPTTNKVVVLPNTYEAGRATIVVYNWQNLGSVAVDLTGVVSPGVDYEVRNAQNFYAPPVVSGTYSGGSVTLPMTALTPATPVGYAAPPPTGPAFNMFVVLSGSLGPPPTASFTYSPASPTANAPVTFTDTSTGSPTTWQWTFGDGGASTQRNPTHTYAGEGTYTVTLTVANSAGRDQTSRSLQVTLRSIPPTSSGFYTLSPCRVIDTRNANGPTGGPALGASSVRIFPVAGACGIPADARTISVNLTVSNTMASGDLRVYPPDIGIPLTWTISFQTGQTRANNAMLTLATDGSGTIGVKNDAPGTVNVIVDVNGYFK